jgi:hypothetical protein
MVRCGMTIFATHKPHTTGRPKVIKTLDALDVAARYLVYKLYEATDRLPMQWATLQGLNESRATIARAVERGWVILQEVSRKPLDRKVTLTDEGRRRPAREDRPQYGEKRCRTGLRIGCLKR